MKQRSKVNLEISGIQEDQYNDPYHYLPELSSDGFRQHRYWSWGYRYLGRLQIVFNLLEGLHFQTLLDVGCGDGRFLGELAKMYPGIKLSGIDISEKALTLARRMNPDLPFEKRDILTSPMEPRWDVVTLLEVVEHIPPRDLPEFMERVHRILKPGGYLIITVPHTNDPLIAKHYQHFTLESLRHQVDGKFDECRHVLFDDIPLSLRILQKLMGGSGKYFIITHQRLNSFLYHYYMKNGLVAASEKKCRRIALLARKSPATPSGKNPQR